MPHYWNDENNTLMSVWNIPHAQREAGNNHPCPYPTALIRPLIESSCPPKGTVLDPFTGSGTTGVVAVGCGRSFVGIEQDERWFDLAVRRIQAAINAPDLFIEQPKPAKQEALEL